MSTQDEGISEERRVLYILYLTLLVFQYRELWLFKAEYSILLHIVTLPGFLVLAGLLITLLRTALSLCNMLPLAWRSKCST